MQKLFLLSTLSSNYSPDPWESDFDSSYKFYDLESSWC